MRVIIVGGGACGVMTALQIKKICLKDSNTKVEVIILEQNDRVLKKVLKTGNGKCNISNSIIDKTKYNDFHLIEVNKKINVNDELSSFGLVLKESDLGRIYPYSESTKSVVNVLMRRLELYNIKIRTNYGVNNIIKKCNKFIINNELDCDYLVMATGSLAQEKTLGYELIKNMGHTISSLRPGLVPIITKEKTEHLQGNRSKCVAHINNQLLAGEILYKNDGLSGILALDISRYAKKEDTLYLDLMPEYSEEQIKSLLQNEPKIEESLEGIFPKMVVFDLIQRVGKEIDKLVYEIKHCKYTIVGFKDFKEAQIVLGGVKLDEMNDNFSSKLIKNLFIGGEVLDIDGCSGGYNLYFAWLSGIVIAKTIMKDINNE